MVREPAELVSEQLNLVPDKQEMSECSSPNAIANKQPLCHRKHCRHLFGAFEQAKTNNVPANAPAERTVDAACLRPNGNKPGCQTLMQAKQQQETKLPQRH